MGKARVKGGFYLNRAGKPIDADGKLIEDIREADEKPAKGASTRSKKGSGKAESTGEPQGGEPQGSQGEGQTPEGTALPADFPAQDLLVEAGLKTVEAVQAASDEQLLAVSGIGPATLKEIREAKA